MELKSIAASGQQDSVTAVTGILSGGKHSEAVQPCVLITACTTRPHEMTPLGKLALSVIEPLYTSCIEPSTMRNGIDGGMLIEVGATEMVWNVVFCPAYSRMSGEIISLTSRVSCVLPRDILDPIWR
jgi:hypothetical protein